MRLIIDIPDEIYQRVAVAPRCVSDLDAFEDRDMFVKAIQNGTPLSYLEFTMENKQLIEFLDLLAPANPRSDWGKIQRTTVNEAIEKMKIIDKIENKRDAAEKIRTGLRMKAEEIIASRDKKNYVEGYIQLHIGDIIDNDYGAFLELLSVSLVDSDLLRDVNYEIVALAEDRNEIILKVTGDVSIIIAE